MTRRQLAMSSGSLNGSFQKQGPESKPQKAISAFFVAGTHSTNIPPHPALMETANCGPHQGGGASKSSVQVPEVSRP